MNIRRMKNPWRRALLIIGIPMFALLVIVIGAALGIWQFGIDTIKDWREAWR